MPDTAVAPPPFRGGSDNNGRGGGGPGIGLLRDPDHYEEINVIGNGKILSFPMCKILLNVHQMHRKDKIVQQRAIIKK